MVLEFPHLPGGLFCVRFDIHFLRLFIVSAALCAGISATGQAAAKPHIFQRPALSRDLIAFGYAGDLWTVPRTGGRAIRLTSGVGIESAPVFSPDGKTVAFTGDYDGNTDVFTVSDHWRSSISRHLPSRGRRRGGLDAGRQEYSVPFQSRICQPIHTALHCACERRHCQVVPLPMAYQGQFSPDGKQIAYSPLGPAFGFNYTAYVAWGNYHGGLASTIWVTTLPELDSVQIPHESASDFSPVFAGGRIYFLSGRKGRITIFRYDPASKKNPVTEALANDGPDIRSLSGEGGTLVYDRLGDIYLYDTATSTSHVVPIEIDADLPEVRPHIENVAEHIENAAISPTGPARGF